MKTRKVLASFTFIALASAAQTSAAAVSGNRYLIEDITIQGTDAARIYLQEGSMSGTAPTCAGTRVTHFAFSLTTAKGRAMLDLAQAAMLSGKRVSVTGLDHCNAMSGFQTLDVLTLWR